MVWTHLGQSLDIFFLQKRGIHLLGGGCPYNVPNRIEGTGVYTVTRTPLQRVEELLDGVTDGLHAIQQDVNNVSAGLVIVIDGVEDFLVNAGAVCFQVVGLEQGIQLVGNESHDLAVCLGNQLLDSACSLSGRPALEAGMPHSEPMMEAPASSFSRKLMRVAASAGCSQVLVMARPMETLEKPPL